MLVRWPTPALRRKEGSRLTGPNDRVSPLRAADPSRDSASVAIQDCRLRLAPVGERPGEAREGGGVGGQWERRICQRANHAGADHLGEVRVDVHSVFGETPPTCERPGEEGCGLDPTLELR